MNQTVEDIINEINKTQIHEGRKLMLYEMRPIMEKHIAKIIQDNNTIKDIANTYIREADSNGFILRGGVLFLYRGIYLGNAMPTPASMIDDKTCTLRFITLY